jgi:hypothetical protein
MNFTDTAKQLLLGQRVAAGDGNPFVVSGDKSFMRFDQIRVEPAKPPAAGVVVVFSWAGQDTVYEPITNYAAGRDTLTITLSLGLREITLES